MAKTEVALGDLVGSLESSLNTVKDMKATMDKAAAAAAGAKKNYDEAVSRAQAAHSAYAAHVNEIMSGFAQIHQ